MRRRGRRCQREERWYSRRRRRRRRRRRGRGRRGTRGREQFRAHQRPTSPASLARPPRSLEDVAAYFWDFDGIAARHLLKNETREIEERSGEWEMKVSRMKKVLSAHSGRSTHRHAREFTNIMKLHKINKDTIVIHLKPDEDESGRRKSIGERMSQVLGFQGSADKKKDSATKKSVFSTKELSSAIKASEKVTMRLKRRKGRFKKETEVEFVTEMNLGWVGVSHKATKIALFRQLDEAVECQRFFAKNLGKEEMTAAAGETLGACMVWDSKKLQPRKSRSKKSREAKKNEKLAKINRICKESKALREILDVHPWFETVLQRARLGEINRNR